MYRGEVLKKGKLALEISESLEGGDAELLTIQHYAPSG